MESIIFVQSKGAKTKREIIQLMFKQSKNSHHRFHNLTSLTEEFSISKVAMKKHVDFLVEKEYLEKINPCAKPIFLKLTDKGMEAAKKYIFY